MGRLFELNGENRWSAVTAAALGAVLLAWVLQLSNGTLHSTAMSVVLGVLALSVLAVAGLHFRWVERWRDRPALAVVLVGVVAFLGIHLTTPPGVYLRVGMEAYIEHHRYVALAAVLIGVGLSDRPLLSSLTVPLLLATYLALGVWLIRASPTPAIDVFVWHEAAFKAVTSLQSPYALSIPNIYGSTRWYAPGVADATTVHMGFPYPPLSLLLAAPGHLLFGDYRYANLAALAGTGACIAWARPSRLSFGIAAVFLFMPRGLFVLEQGWTEANAVFMFALTVLVACRWPKALPWVFGALLATKQYFILISPLALFFIPRPWTSRACLGFFGRAGGLALALTAPLALLDLPNFFRSVVIFQGLQPFRPDALSLMAWTAEGGTPVIPQWASFAAIGVGVGYAFLRAPRSPGGFALGSALSWALFFVFAKQAFCNYYFMVVGALCVAAATIAPVPSGSPPWPATSLADSGAAEPRASRAGTSARSSPC